MAEFFPLLMFNAPNQFREVTRTSYLGSVANSIKGILLGIIFIIISLVILFVNEGRVDLSQIAETAIEISSETVANDPEIEGKLVSTTGKVNSDEVIGDNLFLNPNRFRH